MKDCPRGKLQHFPYLRSFPLFSRVPGHSLRQDGGCEGPSYFTSSLLPITTYKATTPGFFQTTFISSKSSLILWNKKLPLNRAQHRATFFSTPSPQYKNIDFFCGPKIVCCGGREGVAGPCFVLSQGDALQCLRTVWLAFQGVIIVTWNQELRKATSTFLTVFPISGSCAGQEGQGIRPGEKQ